MRKLLFSLFAICTIALTGCLETTQEITINQDGTGTIMNKNDMSPLLEMAKAMGGDNDMDKQESIDSSFSLNEGADSILSLTAAERELARKGSVRIKMNMEESAFFTEISFPFTSTSQVPGINKISSKMISEILKDKVAEGGEGAEDAADQMPPASSFDDYYILEFSNGELSSKVNKEKYAGIESDQFLKAMKEFADKGLAMKANYIINLPRPAVKAEGKNVKLSDDKKKVTISFDINDFFEDAASLEYRIKY